MRDVPVEEVWLDIEGYEGYYQISNKGRVRSLDRVVPCSRTTSRKLRGRLLKLCPDSSGYIIIVLQKDGEKKSVKVHRLVATHFLDRIPGKDIINHIDCDKTNNCVSNLEWCTPKENTGHMHRLGRNYSSFGEENPACKLTDNDVERIRELSKTYTQRYIAQLYNVSNQHISRIVNNKQRV